MSTKSLKLTQAEPLSEIFTTKGGSIVFQTIGMQSGETVDIISSGDSETGFTIDFTFTADDKQIAVALPQNLYFKARVNSETSSTDITVLIVD
jgi:hypothetical protein